MIEVILHFKSSYFVRNHASCDFIRNKTSSVLETRKAQERGGRREGGERRGGRREGGERRGGRREGGERERRREREIEEMKGKETWDFFFATLLCISLGSGNRKHLYAVCTVATLTGFSQEGDFLLKSINLMVSAR